MGLTAWTRDVGTIQGRIQPQGWTPQDTGLWVFCLGRDEPGFGDRINEGDAVQVSQGGTWSAQGSLLYIPARLRSPLAVPLGVWWRFSVLVDGVEVVGKTFAPRGTRDLNDLAISLGTLTGTHTIAFQLALQGSAGTYELEIPAAYVDALEPVTITGRMTREGPLPPPPQFINRDPQPGDVQVPADTNISIDLVDVAGDGGIDLTNTSISVNGVPAFVNGVFQAGFTGPASMTSSPLPDTKRVVIDPLAVFTNQEAVSVHVLTQTVGGSSSIGEIYSFTSERLDGPSVISVTPVDQKTITVDFDEAVVQGDGTASDDSLNPANYTIDRAPLACAVSLQVVAVTALSSTSVQLTTDIEMTRGASYGLTVENVRDLFGNEVLA